MSKKRIGIYGGTFDPIHLGHLQVAEAILDNFCLDSLIFVPAHVPPHKRKQTISSPFHRLSMLVLATADRPRMFVSTIELETPERPYTIDTLSRLQVELGDVQLFFLMGADSFREIRLWREHERLLSEFDCIVALRPGSFSIPNLQEVIEYLAHNLHTKIVDLRGRKRPEKFVKEEKAELLCQASGMSASTQVYLTDYVAVDVSATNLREAVARGESIIDQVPAAVAGYIAKYGLYPSSK